MFRAIYDPSKPVSIFNELRAKPGNMEAWSVARIQHFAVAVTTNP